MADARTGDSDIMFT